MCENEEELGYREDIRRRRWAGSSVKVVVRVDVGVADDATGGVTRESRVQTRSGTPDTSYRIGVASRYGRGPAIFGGGGKSEIDWDLRASMYRHRGPTGRIRGMPIAAQCESRVLDNVHPELRSVIHARMSDNEIVDALARRRCYYLVSTPRRF